MNFLELAHDPACLAAIDAVNGGTWYSLLRPGVVYPSAIFRNFATESAIWKDVARFMREADPASDYDMLMEWTDAPSEATKTVFYCTNSNLYAQPGIYRISASQYSVIYNPFPVVGGQQVKVITRNADRNVLRIVRSGTSGYAEYNGVRFAESTGTVPNPLISATDLYYSNYDGIITKLRLQIGSKVWQYPSFEERTRLITKTNVWTENGIFERAKASGTYNDTNWYIKTPCFIHGSTKSLTMVTRCYFFDGPAATWNYRSPIGDENMFISFKNQTGNISAGPSQGLFFYAYVRNSTDTGDLLLSFTISDWATMSLYFNRWVVLSMVLDFDTYAYPVLRCYADGVLIGTASGNSNFAKKLASKSPEIPICVGPQNLVAAAYKNGCEKVSHALLFDRGLRSNEIQLLR